MCKTIGELTPKLTLNLGLRYQWSTPFTERHNNSQFSDFDGDSGISVPGFAGTLKGTTIFASNNMRNLPTDRKDIAPRFGFAYLVNDTLAIRGGAGVYYGMSVATNYQYPGTAFTSSPDAFFTKDGYLTRDATLENPFPGGIEPPQGRSYGNLASGVFRTETISEHRPRKTQISINGIWGYSRHSTLI